MYYCTHSDKNYLAKGLALCQNIIEHNEASMIVYLCLDGETFDAVQKSFSLGVVAIKVSAIENAYPELLAYKKLGHTSNYGTAHSQYCWALTPFLTWFLLNEMRLPENTEILYCDADLYFYQNPAKIAEACKNKSVGIHSHGFSSYDSETNDVGEFNVGCVYFKNNETGRKVAETWKNWLLNPQNEYAAKYGTCGDQKYLDLFIPLFGAENICVFDREADIKHGAPWNVPGSESNILFYHFSHFNTDFNGNWRSSNNGEWMPEKDIPHIKNLYEQYNNKVTQANQLITK